MKHLLSMHTLSFTRASKLCSVAEDLHAWLLQTQFAELLGDSDFASKSLPCGMAVWMAISCQSHQIRLGCQSEGMTERHCSRWPSRLGHLITLIIAVHLERAALRGEMVCSLNKSGFQPLWGEVVFLKLFLNFFQKLKFCPHSVLLKSLGAVPVLEITLKNKWSCQMLKRIILDLSAQGKSSFSLS